MRTFLVASATLASLVTVASLTSVASAEPYDAVTGTTVTPQPTRFVEAGAMFGGNHDMLTAALMVDGGQQLGEHLWLHGRMAVGAGDRLFDHTVASDFEQLRVGLDSRGCVANGTLCAYAGMDLGVQHTAWRGYETDWFEETTDTMETSTSSMEPIAVPRVGLDIGGRHLRWRSGLEADVAPTGLDGVNATSAVAYRF